MTCPICTNKAPNCDCTDGDKRAYELEEELEEIRSNRLSFTPAQLELLLTDAFNAGRDSWEAIGKKIGQELYTAADYIKSKEKL